MISLKFNKSIIVRNCFAIILIFLIYFGLKNILILLFLFKTIHLSISLKVTTKFYYNKLYYLSIKDIKLFLFFYHDDHLKFRILP